MKAVKTRRLKAPYPSKCVTEEEELPYDAPYPLTSVSTSEVSTCTSDSTEDSEGSAAPPLRFPIFIEPSAELNSTESLNGSEGRNESTLQSGLFIHDDTGRVNLVARRSDSQNAPSMLHFSPMATSTSETPTNNQIHQAGGLRVQIPEDVNEPGPSTAPPRLYDEESAVVSNMAQPSDHGCTSLSFFGSKRFSGPSVPLVTFSLSTAIVVDQLTSLDI